MRPCLIVMVKEPRAGRVKTRLARDLGLIQATWWYRHQALRTLRNLTDPRWDTVLAVTPDRDGVQSSFWPEHFSRIPQGTGHLGQRMARALRRMTPRPTCLIGSDIPDIEKSHIAAAFSALGSHTACLGPATDGGYWLIGLRHPAQQPVGFLDHVRWSTEWAKADTIASAKSLSWAELETLSDIDTGADYEQWVARL